MDKYRETKDLEEVEKALVVGLAVETGGQTVGISCSSQLHYTNAGMYDMPTLCGRIFRIEILRPEAPDGWVVLDPGEDINQLDKALGNDGLIDKDYIAPFGKQNQNLWYVRKIEAESKAPKRRLDRVELLRNKEGELVYRESDGVCRCHTCAVSKKGFNQYVYADDTKSFAPVRTISKDANEFPVAFERWVEEE